MTFKTIDVAVVAVGVAPMFLWSAAVSHNFQPCQKRWTAQSELDQSMLDMLSVPAKQLASFQVCSLSAMPLPTLRQILSGYACVIQYCADCYVVPTSRQLRSIHFQKRIEGPRDSLRGRAALLEAL